MEKEVIDLKDISKIKVISIKLDNKFTKNILEKASKSISPHTNKKFIEKIGRKFRNYSNHTIYRWYSNKRAIPVSDLPLIMSLSKTSWKEIEKNLMYIKVGSTRIKPCFPIKVDEKIGSIVGHILGDGSIDKKYQQIFFSNSEKELLKEFLNNMKAVFNAPVRIWMQRASNFGNTHWDKRLDSIEELIEGRNAGLFYPTICGLILNYKFDNFAVGKNKNIANHILKCNKYFKKGLIRAFFDDESTVTEKSIRVFQDKKEILERIKELLIEFYIDSGEIKATIKKDKKRYYFNIFKKSNLKKFQLRIGFTSPKKLDRLNKIVLRKPHWNDK